MQMSPMRIIENDSFVSDVDVMFGVANRVTEEIRIYLIT